MCTSVHQTNRGHKACHKMLLGARPRRAHALLAAGAHSRALGDQRMLWSRAAGIMNWLGVGSSEEPKPEPQDTKKPNADEQPSKPSNEQSKPKAKFSKAKKTKISQSRGSAVKLSTTPLVLLTDEEVIKDGQLAISALSRRLQHATKVSHLLSMHKVMASYKPFYLDDQLLRPWDASVNGEHRLMQMLPMDSFVALNKEVTGPARPREWEIAQSVVSHDGSILRNVLFLSEARVTRYMIQALARLGDNRKVTQFYERFERSRKAAIESLLEDSKTPSRTAEEEQQQRKQLSRLTSLRTGAAEVLYIEALSKSSASQQIIAFFEEPVHVQKYLGTISALRTLLTACVAELRGDVARKAIDDFAKTFPHMTIPMQSYQSAIQANLKTKGKTDLQQLDNAMHIYRKMKTDTGYILHPFAWSMLFNACVYVKNHDAALEVFADYPRQGMPAFHERYVKALRTACVFGQYDTVLALVKRSIKIEAKRAPPSLLTGSGTTKRYNYNKNVQCKPDPAEATGLNNLLWEMFKGEPQLTQLQTMLELMESRRAVCGAIVLRRIVSRSLRRENCAVNATKSPSELLAAWFQQWERVPHVIARNAFVVHLVLEHCLQEQWLSECHDVVQYAIQQQIELPPVTLRKVMDANHAQGFFAQNVALGELVVKAPQAEPKMTASFYEAFLMSCMRENQLQRVLELNESLKVTERFPESEMLATLVRDAAQL